MRDYTDEENYQERTNIVFYPDDLDCIAKIQQFVGIRGKAAAVTPNLLIPTTPPDKEA